MPSYAIGYRTSFFATRSIRFVSMISFADYITVCNKKSILSANTFRLVFGFIKDRSRVR